MSKYVQFALVIIYGSISLMALYLLFFLLLNGRLNLNDWMIFAIIAGWLTICFSAVYWCTNIFLFFRQVRKPILEEEQRLIVSLHEIQKRAYDKNHYRLRVEETNDLNAFAIGYNTIVVSKNCIKNLSHEELCALLAHEMGHLRTKDPMAGLAFHFANLLPGFVNRFLTAALKFSENRIKAVIRRSLLAAFITIIVLLFILSKTSVLNYLLPIVGFVIVLWLLNVIFFFLWLLNSRFTEYRQDAFAHKLGFGTELKQVLIKIIETHPHMRVDQFSVITGSTHPILHKRIRRLEKLQGFRK
jgi:Zn-dependent protease with chaperone function